MKSISRSILARSLMTGAASLALMTMDSAVVRAETVIVQGDDGVPSGEGESVAANAGDVHPITTPLNKATATGGNGGPGPPRLRRAATVATAAEAARPLQPRPQRLSPARRKRTLNLTGVAGVAAVAPATPPFRILVMAARGAMAGQRPQKAQRRIQMRALSSAVRQRQVGKGVRAVPTATSVKAAQEAEPRLMRRVTPGAAM
jgi:hypothetical protein